jgi:uncharacterized membrane protein
MPAVTDLPTPADAVIRGTRAATATLMLALVALGMAWELWLAPTGSRSLALKVLPLIVPLSGVLKLRLTSYRGLSLLVWVYVCEGALRASSDTGLSARLAWVELGLCGLLFAACTLHIRWRLGHPKLATP